MSGPWEEYQKKETPEETGPWNDYKAPAAEDNSKYGGALNAAGTFLANTVNSATFGLPDYLNKTFTPETYAEGQKYNQANPMAATAGDIAGYVIPTGAGVIKGAQLGAKVVPALARGAEYLAGKIVPNAAVSYPTIGPAIREAANFLTQKTGAVGGGIIGAQTAAALPGVVHGNPAEAAAGGEAINNLPYTPNIPGPLQHAVPALGAGAASLTQDAYIKMRMQYEAAMKALGMK
jgi:hypothetical protein